MYHNRAMPRLVGLSRDFLLKRSWADIDYRSLFDILHFTEYRLPGLDLASNLEPGVVEHPLLAFQDIEAKREGGISPTCTSTLERRWTN
jgi:hypothetical protein